MATRSRSCVPRNLNTARKPSTRYYSKSPEQMVKAIDKIHQCQISEREYYEEYMVWDEVVTKCIWNGNCSANGNALNNQIVF